MCVFSGGGSLLCCDHLPEEFQLTYLLLFFFITTCGHFHLITGQAIESRSTHRDRYQSQGNTANVISRRTQLMMHGDGQRTLRELAV